MDNRSSDGGGVIEGDKPWLPATSQPFSSGHDVDAGDSRDIYNEVDRAESTMTAIMGRMASYWARRSGGIRP